MTTQDMGLREWALIENIPENYKNGRTIWGFGTITRGEVPFCGEMYFHLGFWRRLGSLVEPTHWMLPPDPPEDSQ